jgi:hypothetical protein
MAMPPLGSGHSFLQKGTLSTLARFQGRANKRHIPSVANEGGPIGFVANVRATRSFVAG